MLQGVSTETRKRHHANAPKFLQRVIMRAQQCREPAALKGAAFCPQQCHNGCAPTSFIWCHDHLAEMPLLKRTKGRGHPACAEMPNTSRLSHHLQEPS